MDLPRQPVSDAILLLGKVKVALKIEPELRGDAKVASETQRSVCRDAPVAMNKFVDPPGRDADVLRQAVLRNAHRLEELLHEDFTRVDGQYLSLAHSCKMTHGVNNVKRYLCLLRILKQCFRSGFRSLTCPGIGSYSAPKNLDFPLLSL